MIADRTGGNPFFIEEVVQSLVDAGSLVGERGAYRLAVRYGVRTHEGLCRAMLGRALSRSHPTEAHAELEHALELVGADYVSVAPRIHEALADLAEMHGGEQEYERQLREALQGYERIGAHGHASHARERLAGRAGTAV